MKILVLKGQHEYCKKWLVNLNLFYHLLFHFRAIYCIHYHLCRMRTKVCFTVVFISQLCIKFVCLDQRRDTVYCRKVVHTRFPCKYNYTFIADATFCIAYMSLQNIHLLYTIDFPSLGLFIPK